MIRNNLMTEPSSFRDPSGQLFYQDGRILRQVNKSFAADFELLVKSGLYQKLVDEEMLFPFRKVSKDLALTEDAYCVLETEKIPFISYPYEWSFSQFKDAALLTLKIQKIALEYNMSLKDSSAYNIQFYQGKPVLIDSLSFEKYDEGKPWIAYRQFCQHFFGPLALMSYKDVRLNRLLLAYIDGLPLNMVSRLLPLQTWLSFPFLTHLHLHGKSQERFSDAGQDLKKFKIKVSKPSLLAIINSLGEAIKSLALKTTKSEWSHYYDSTNYSRKAFLEKKRLVTTFLKMISPRQVWDLGANTGEFSRLVSRQEIDTIAFDIDPLTVEKNYLKVKKNNEKHLLPLFSDLTNPSPSIGWQNAERRSLIERGPTDCVLALALIHHWAISNNLPLGRIAEFMSLIGNYLIIEFIPKDDSQVQILLSTRKDIFGDYSQNSFESAFGRFFKIMKLQRIASSKRILYYMKKL
jgi:hypothetical protein